MDKLSAITKEAYWWRQPTAAHAHVIGDDSIPVQGTDHDRILEERYGIRPPGRDTTFQQYLDECGIVHFTRTEIVDPSEEQPGRWTWSRFGLLAILVDDIRDAIKAPITLASTWRTPAFNAEVHGAERSDHIFACAFDIHFKSEADRRRAWPYVCQRWDDDELELSVGLLLSPGYHLGCLSPLGRRRWSYRTAKIDTPRGPRLVAQPCHWDESRVEGW